VRAASFGASYDDANDTLVVRHLGGDGFEAGHLHVTVAGVDWTWAERADVPASSRVVAGDRLHVRNASAGATVHVWARWGGERHTFLETTAGAD